MTTTLWEISLIVLASIVGASAPIFLKKGMNRIKQFHFWELICNSDLYLGIGIYALSYVISIPAFRKGDVSILYPCVSVGYIWASVLSVKYLGEKMNAVKWLGISFIIFGVSLIGFAR